MGLIGLDPPSTHQSLGNCSRPSHSWRVSSVITSSFSELVLSPDPLRFIGTRRFLMTAHASPHSPNATRSWKLLRGLESSLSLFAWYWAMSTRESPGFWDLWRHEDVNDRRFVKSHPSGLSEGILLGWTKEASCAISFGPRADSESSCILHRGIGTTLPNHVSDLEREEKVNFAEIKNPMNVRNRARNHETL